MNGYYQKDWNCDGYCSAGDIKQPNGYHWIDCPNHPKNIEKYGVSKIKNNKTYDEKNTNN